MAALVVVSAWVLPRWHAVLPADVAARVVLGALWIAVWLLAALGAGRPVLRWARLTGNIGLGGTLGTGTAVLAFVATVLAATGLLRPVVLLALLGAFAVSGALGLTRGGAPHPPWAGGPVWPWVLLAAPALVQLLGITAPPVFYDTLGYHLAFPQRWLMAGGWIEFPRDAYSYYPSAVDILGTFGLAGVGGWGARAIGLAFSWIAALAAGELAGRLGGRRAAWWAAALLFLTPALLQTGPLAIADSGVAAWAAAALLVLLRTHEIPRPRCAVALAGFLAGSAFAGKYIAGATVVLPLVAAALLAVEGPIGRRLRVLPSLAAGGTLAAAPWLLRNLLWTGDPLYPYLAGLFGIPPVGMTLAGELAQNGTVASGLFHHLVTTVMALPFRTFHPLQVGGVIGPQWLLLLIPAVLLVRGRRSWPLWAAAVTGLLGWGALVQFGRFLLPVLVPLAALLGTAAARLTVPRRPRDPVAAAVLVLLATVLAWNASAVLDPLAAERIDVLTGRITDAAYRRHWVSYWPAVDPIARLVPPEGKVLLVGEARCYGIPRDVIVEDPYRTPLLVELAEASPDAAALRERLRTLGVTHLLVNRLEMARIARMRGRREYFGEASPGARERIRSVLGGARRAWAEGPLELLELAQAPNDASARTAGRPSRCRGV